MFAICKDDWKNGTRDWHSQKSEMLETTKSLLAKRERKTSTQNQQRSVGEQVFFKAHLDIYHEVDIAKQDQPPLIYRTH
jgi:hypothetical protein